MLRQLEMFRSALAVQLRTKAKSIWKNPWFGWLMIVGFSLWYLWWGYNIPSPAKAATVLGFIAAVMALRGEPEGFEKMFWTIVLFAFLFMELKAIDRKDQDDELARKTQRTEEAEQFKRIGIGIQRTITQSDKQFQVTAKGLESTIKSSTQAVIQTRPRAFIEWTNIDFVQLTAEDKKTLNNPNAQFAVNVKWTNNGQDVATHEVMDATGFVGKLDDASDQQAIAKKFEDWWRTTEHLSFLTTQPQEPALGTYIMPGFSDKEMDAVKNKQATIYLLLRWVYSDSTGRWVRDDCMAFQNPLHDFQITHPCHAHNNHHYPMPKTLITPVRKYK